MIQDGRRAPLRRLSFQQLQGAITQMRDASEAHYDGDHLAWERWEAAYGDVRVRLECPLAELLRPPLTGWAAAWWWAGAVRIETLTEHDRFRAHGLEFKAVVEDTFTRILLAASELPDGRVAVSVPPELLGRLERT